MAHLPHVYIASPWSGEALALPDGTRHHLERVLRRTAGDVTYTDGVGNIGEGRLEKGKILRGEERSERPPTPQITLAVAPPRRTERARFLVEKLAELGVSRLRWVSTAFSEGRPPPLHKATAWAVGALEQSRGAHLLEVSGNLEPLANVTTADAIYVDVAGDSVERGWLEDDQGTVRPRLILVVGPEAGLADDEVPSDAHRLGLGDRILRIETAAIVAAALVNDAARRVT